MSEAQSSRRSAQAQLSRPRVDKAGDRAARVLIVEDQERVARAIALLLDLHGIIADTAATPAEALERLERPGGESLGVVVQDMNFSPGKTSGTEGHELFRAIRRARPDVQVLLITAWGSVEAAVRLMQDGAGDYLEKPWDDDRLLTSVRNLLRVHDLEHENLRLEGDLRRARDELAERYDLRGLVYRSAAMHEVVSLAVRVARADVPVLITGANGTGKEKLAEVVQANSPRRDQPFVRVDVGALPESLIEAELFGSEAGAFTGAGKRRVGRFEAADGGTLLLDEIGNLSAAGQMKLLRVLQTGELERLGSSKTLRVDVRVVAATNSDLRAEIDAGRFREDLFFRLNVIELRVPALADRPDDILPLAESFLRETSSGVVAADALRTLAADARDALRAHPWPGNVRELRNAIQRAVLISSGDALRADDLGLVAAATGAAARAAARSDAGGLARVADTGEPARPTRTDDGDAQERRRIEESLLAHGGVVAHAAESLGLSRQALYRRMQRLGIVLERRPRS